MARNEDQVYGVAPLENVTRMAALITRIKGRAHGLPGLGCIYGRAGLGKTTAATWACNAMNAVHVEALPIGGVKGLLTMIVRELGQRPARTTEALFIQAVEQLARSQRPLLIDEADHILSDKPIEIVRRLHDVSQAPVILIGEELLPQKLVRWERVHSRILSWVGMEPATAGDVDHLAKIYARNVVLGPDLKSALLKASRGSLRNVSTNLAHVAEFAVVQDLTSVDLSTWGQRVFHSGEAPPPRDLPATLRRRGMAA
jgi:DNA transposition AAA+ family ATPase